MPKYRRPIIFVGTRADMEPLLETAEELGIPVLGILDRFYVGKKVEGIDVIGSDLDLINPVSNPVTELLEYADFFVASYFSGTTNTEIDSQNIFQLRMERIDLVKQAR